MANDVDIAAPAPQLLAGTHGAGGTAPAPTLVAALSWVGDSQVLTASGSAPAPSLASTLVAGGVVSAALRAPAPALVAALTAAVPITFDRAPPAPRLSASVLTGTVLTADLVAPAPSLAGMAYPANSISAALVAPAPRLVATLGSPVIAAYRTWVLNTRKGALTEYGPEFAFNSFARFNNQTLACGSAGVVVLGTQGQDNTTNITARVRTGKEGFESSLHKRVPRIYTSGEFAGPMMFRTLVEGGTRGYLLPYNGTARLQQRRVPVGKGPKSRFWQFELENVDGADFSVNDILVYPTTLRRRVQ